MYHTYNELVQGVITPPQWYDMSTFRSIKYVLKYYMLLLFSEMLLPFSDKIYVVVAIFR